MLWAPLWTDGASLAGIVEVEEGEVNGQELCIASHSIARISFAKEPHVEQVSPSMIRDVHFIPWHTTSSWTLSVSMSRLFSPLPTRARVGAAP